MGSRAPVVFRLGDLATDAAALCQGLRPCLPLSPGRVDIQAAYYLDTADDALYGDGGVLLAKPQPGYWSLIREQAGSGRPMGGSRVEGMPATIMELPAGPLREQLRTAVGDEALQIKGEVQLSRQPLAAPGEAPRLLLETAVSGERVIGRRMLLIRRPRPDGVETQLLARLAGIAGGEEVSGHSWYAALRPELAA
jgi:hypothetical protein